MGKEEAKEMNTSALGSTFEISLRILLLLNEVHGTALDEQQIGAVDFISVYAAETIRRGVLELGSGRLSDQFNVLKGETLDGVKDTAKRAHPNGFDHMLAVMEQAVNAPVKNYLLSASPYWISGKIKKGVCHHLVNDGKLVWVKRRQKK